jgi:hypothetical protein
MEAVKVERIEAGLGRDREQRLGGGLGFCETACQIQTGGLVLDSEEAGVGRRPVAEDRICLGVELIGTLEVAVLPGEDAQVPEAVHGEHGLVEPSTEFDELLVDGPSFVSARGLVEQLPIGDQDMPERALVIE